MNPVSEAIRLAVKTARCRETLEAEFDRNIRELQFAPNAHSSVLAVPLSDAIQWVNGRISDLELILRINGHCGAIWWFALPRRGEMYSGLEDARKFYRSGAQAFITYTASPIVKKHCLKLGFRVVFDDGEGVRLLANRETMDRWTFFRPLKMETASITGR